MIRKKGLNFCLLLKQKYTILSNPVSMRFLSSFQNTSRGSVEPGGWPLKGLRFHRKWSFNLPQLGYSKEYAFFNPCPQGNNRWPNVFCKGKGWIGIDFLKPSLFDANSDQKSFFCSRTFGSVILIILIIRLAPLAGTKKRMKFLCYDWITCPARLSYLPARVAPLCPARKICTSSIISLIG